MFLQYGYVDNYVFIREIYVYGDLTQVMMTVNEENLDQTNIKLKLNIFSRKQKSSLPLI